MTNPDLAQLAWSAIGDAVGPVVDRPGLEPLLDKVRHSAWKIDDADVARLSADELYEAALPVAYETADDALRRALEAIDAD
ncbi:MAG TPA: hypothetical protein VE261_05055 [Gaiellaceae bacterium]|nr:hypothetical protein [Gaiellaceae bacterium]